jgi:hypothetical protein
MQLRFVSDIIISSDSRAINVSGKKRESHGEHSNIKNVDAFFHKTFSVIIYTARFSDDGLPVRFCGFLSDGVEEWKISPQKIAKCQHRRFCI